MNECLHDEMMDDKTKFDNACFDWRYIVLTVKSRGLVAWFPHVGTGLAGGTTPILALERRGLVGVVEGGARPLLPTRLGLVVALRKSCQRVSTTFRESFHNIRRRTWLATWGLQWQISWKWMQNGKIKMPPKPMMPFCKDPFKFISCITLWNLDH